MKRLIVYMCIILSIITFTGCGPKDGDNLPDVEKLLEKEPVLQSRFSTFSVTSYNGDMFDLRLDFKKITSEEISNMSHENIKTLCQQVYSRAKKAIKDSEYKSIASIEGNMYPADMRDLIQSDKDYYYISFDVGAANKTYVSLRNTGLSDSVWSEEVSWGGWEK